MISFTFVVAPGVKLIIRVVSAPILFHPHYTKSCQIWVNIEVPYRGFYLAGSLRGPRCHGRSARRNRREVGSLADAVGAQSESASTLVRDSHRMAVFDAAENHAHPWRWNWPRGGGGSAADY